MKIISVFPFREAMPLYVKRWNATRDSKWDFSIKLSKQISLSQRLDHKLNANYDKRKIGR